MKKYVLLVEDDPDLGSLLSQYLRVKGFTVTLAVNGEAALIQLSTQSFDIVILDVMLPGSDGFVLAGRLRQQYASIPFLFLTARRQQEDVLRGLSLGADDYLVKPFDADELVLRISNILRRCAGQITQPDIFRIGSYRFEPAQLQLTRKGQRQQLTQKEADLLEILCQSAGRLVQRKTILETVWGSADFFNGRSLDVFVRRLRKHLDQDPNIRVEVIRSSGFILRIETNV
ncbi:response regulator transcription factor [Mucilaginibacter litoreus]|uniref:Response regulator transcription factor n=1 Tax=Mucilaginibacter litoreus TaxID=1048221 RepID=A0ABW3AUH3_9SPHI